VLPIRKERSIELELPPAQNAVELTANLQRILAAVGEGRITPGEMQVLVEALKAQERLFESVELERRIQALEDFQPEVKAYRSRQASEAQRFGMENTDLRNLRNATPEDEKAA
jgi:hypothetical protein